MANDGNAFIMHGTPSQESSSHCDDLVSTSEEQADGQPSNAQDEI
jgi:hypothetical protein